MEIDKIRNLSEEELKNEQAKAAEQIFRIRFQKSLGNTEGVKKLRTLKLDVARIKTIARERALATGSTGASKPVAVAAAPVKSTRKKAKKD